MDTFPQSSFNTAALVGELEKRRLAVWKASESSWQTIPVALEPVVVAKSDWDKLCCDARLVFSAFPLLLSWLQRLENQSLWQGLFSKLEGIESWAAAQDPSLMWGHATVRFDLFWQDDGELKIIEANCTIPAMQAYSDIVQGAWLQAVGGVPHSYRVSQNSDQLLDSLLGLYHQNGGTTPRPKVLVLHREGDSQLAELQHYRKTWQNRVDVILATPEGCTIGSTKIMIENQPIDIVYRHIFAWRLNEHRPWVLALQDHRRFHIYNPVSAHYEVKAFFALLSQVADDESLWPKVGFSATQRHAILKRLPWTRIVPSKNSFCNSRLEINAQSFEENCHDYVVKNSMGYGGHQVFIGTQWDEPESQRRLRGILKVSGHVSASQFWRWMEDESNDTWIVQTRMAGRRHKTSVLGADGHVTEVDGYVDASIFLSSGTNGDQCGGGVSRFAAGPLVNIGAGGGLAPFFVSS